MIEPTFEQKMLTFLNPFLEKKSQAIEIVLSLSEEEFIKLYYIMVNAFAEPEEGFKLLKMAGNIRFPYPFKKDHSANLVDEVYPDFICNPDEVDNILDRIEASTMEEDLKKLSTRDKIAVILLSRKILFEKVSNLKEKEKI